MLSRSRLTAVVFLMVTLFLSSIPVHAQTGTDDWSRVTALPSGTKLSIKLKSGKSVKGLLNNASDSGVFVNVKNNNQQIKKEDVQAVYRVSKKSATTPTLVGTAIGAGAGAALGGIGASGDDYFDSLDNAVIAGMTVIGAGIGAITGYLIGRSGRKKELVYQSN